jgi:hypothetical protein
MRRQSDLGPILVIALGAFVSLSATRIGVFMWRATAFGQQVLEGQIRATVEAVEGTTGPFYEACSAPFHLGADPSDWAVVGDYDGTARLGPKGLSVELAHGVTLAGDRDAQVRGIVFGLAQASGDGAWSVTHSAEPIPVGALERGVPHPVRPARVLIPGVGPEELADGWLVVEHVLDAPEVDGGTAWTYLHAERPALHSLLGPGCTLR